LTCFNDFKINYGASPGLCRICARSSGINNGPAGRNGVYAELLAGISQAKAELCAVINAKNNTLKAFLFFSIISRGKILFIKTSNTLTQRAVPAGYR